MLKYMKGVLLSLFLLLTPIQSKATDLIYTSPCFTMNQWMVWDEGRQDSVLVRDCNPSQIPLHDLLKVYLWKKDMGPGTAFTVRDSHYVYPCLPDTFFNQGPGFYYTLATNLVGGVCGSNMATIMPTILTDVPVQEIPGKITKIEIFDLQGRKVDKIKASGVYWVREHRGKRAITKKVVYFK